jgi:hypothetical protein
MSWHKNVADDIYINTFPRKQKTGRFWKALLPYTVLNNTGLYSICNSADMYTVDKYPNFKTDAQTDM